MTRKHFKALAEAIATIKNKTERERVAVLIAGVCRDSNPNFNSGVFYKACQLTCQHGGICHVD